MARNGQNEMLFAAGAALLHRAEDHCVYTLGGSDGRVQITQYAVFPGIWILYRDVHAGVQLPVAASTAGLLEIDHCREGRMEFQYGQAHFFLSPGDLAVLRCDAARSAASFPTGHYHGISVMLDPHRAPDCLSCILRDVNVRPAVLAEKLCAGTAYFAARSSARVEHIFSELYNVPEDIRRGYFKVKVLELLLFLSALPAEPPRRSYTGAQVALAKAASARLLEQTEGKRTVAALAAEFGVTAAQLTTCFRGVYGMSPAAFLRAQKMHAAAVLLRSTDRTVLDIAGQFGYDNGSKFAKAFRSVIGVTPNAYRAGAERDSCAPQEAAAEASEQTFSQLNL